MRKRIKITIIAVVMIIECVINSGGIVYADIFNDIFKEDVINNADNISSGGSVNVLLEEDTQTESTTEVISNEVKFENENMSLR